MTELEVLASRASEKTPVAYTNVTKKDLNLRLGSRDIPLALNMVPSVYSTGQGGGAGDARINVRGFNQRNVAIMINTGFRNKKDFISVSNRSIANLNLVHKKIFFVPLTLHLEIKKVSREYKKANKYIKKIKSLNQTIIRDFGIKKPKLIMAGINPHNGENGIISKEDDILVKPIIYKLKKLKIDIHGPISPDAIINKKNLDNFDCFIFTYHDQALIPFKLISEYSGVNYTSNLDIIRVSPDHGTAYDIVGKKNESSLGIINSFKLLKKISLNRTKYERTKKILRSKFPN